MPSKSGGIMTEKERVKKIVALWRQILEFQKGRCPSLMLHGIKIEELSQKEWRFSGGVTESGNKYISAYPLDEKLNGLTLFD
jgi:hypothetical protein